MSWTILPHVSVCIASDRIILLDLRRDRYFMVPPTRTSAVRTWLTGRSSCLPPHGLLELLRASGVYVEGDPEPCCVQNDITPILASVSNSGPAAAGLMTIAAVSRIVIATAIALKRRPLKDLLSDHKVQHHGGGHDLVRQSALAQSFEAARRFVPVERRCLIDSLALRRWLRRHGQRADLIFGVAGLPFAAHCWLQVGGALLNDSYDRVSRFTPICIQ